jgi:DNA replication protein DnaC
MGGLPMSSLKTPGRPNFKPATTIKYCDCDAGLKPIYDVHYHYLGREIMVELEDVFTFCDCDAGLNFKETWQRDVCNHCSNGVINHPPASPWFPVKINREDRFCLNCEAGKKIYQQLEKAEVTHRETILAEWRSRSGLAPLQLKQTFDNYFCKPDGPGEKAIVLLKTAAKEKKSLLLIGNTGVGKSHLAAAYLNFSIQIGNFGLFISLTELMAALRKTINTKEVSPSWDELLEKYINTPLLVLDDIGQEKPSEKVNEVLFTLLNSRINWERPTVVTTNYGKDVLLETGYSPAIVSRLGSFEIARLSGEDYRVKNRGNLKIVDPWQ